MPRRRDEPVASLVRVPVTIGSPASAILRRLLVAGALLVLITLLVYVDRAGYRDAVDDRVTLLDAAYYATVTLSTTGYGDITPATDAARLVNLLVITPARVLFLIILVGTTLEVLTERSRDALRVLRWRSHVSQHTIVIGYGTKGRSAVHALLDTGVRLDHIVVIDTLPLALADATRSGIVTVAGSATRTDVLREARADRAASIVIAVDSDQAAALITLTAREIAPQAQIVAAVREDENAHLLRQSGADSVITSSATAGRLLGLSTRSPRLVDVVEDLLVAEEGLAMRERPVAPDEVGKAPRECDDLILSVCRDDRSLRFDDPEIGSLRSGDLLVVVYQVDGKHGRPATP